MEQYEQAVRLWKSWEVTTGADLDKYLDSFRVLFAYHSGKMENREITYHDTRDIFERGKVSDFTGDPRALFEQQNQKLCYEVLKQKFSQRAPLTLELVRELHRVLTGGTYDERRYVDNGERPGEFKKHDYVTGIHEVGSAPEYVEEDLRQLLDEVNESGARSPLQAGAYLHARFEYIHPFADGNGRVGRTLLNYWLLLNDHPPVIIYDEDRREYYAALNRYDEEEVLAPLTEFLRRETAKTWERSLEHAEGLRQQRRGLQELL